MAAAETVQADPTGIAYDDAGQGDPSLLFMHGWCGDRSFFAPQASHFSTAHRVLNVDLPAHGQSSAPAAFTIEGLATEVTALARSLRLSRIVAVGHSIGAMVALELTAQAPELVSAVVMVDPPPLSKEVWQGFAGQLIPSFQGPDGAAGRRRFVEQMFLPTDDADRRAQIIATMCAVPNDLAIPLVRAMAAYDSVAVLRKCTLPVLAIGSAVPANEPAFLRDANSAVTFGQTVGSGHFNQLEVPEQVNPMIERFLAVLPGT
jgi:pimeloyl-ACP methyl ester carboxylesterase